MSSGFVSGGTVDAPIERDAAWLTAQKEIEANRQRKLDEQARLSDGRSLYETLEANKAAKQDAFDEANRLKNQFRSLDEDEIEFLDSVLESTRAEEERVKRETKEGLLAFRKQQEEADKKGGAGASVGGRGIVDEGLLQAVEEESWGAAGGRKRKRAKEKEGIKGVKIRRPSTAASEEVGRPVQTASIEMAKTEEPARDEKRELLEKGTLERGTKTSIPVVAAKKPPAAVKSSLVAYGSDSEDD